MSTHCNSKSTPAPSSSTPADRELEQLLSREASAFQREHEVERILKAFKLNPYDLLDLDETAKPEDIKRKYRQLSLFIHPDKTPHPRASDAFDLLKKVRSTSCGPLQLLVFAFSTLSFIAHSFDRPRPNSLTLPNAWSSTQRLPQPALPSSAPSLYLPTSSDDDPRIKNLANDPKMIAQGLTTPWRIMLKEKVKEVLIDEEVRRRKAIKMNLANEGLEARKKEEEVASRKRKAEEDKQWEESRETRVDSWRSFSNGAKKKKKSKVAILG
ncbi:DnaJ-domain-containing protein [Melanogaster broomeanus]|nr:DnaJ-domain-containing protein [Melanogaster broomeanus]